MRKIGKPARITTMQPLAIKHAGTMDVIGVVRLPRNFSASVNASDARADQGAVLSIGPCIIRHRSGSFLRDLRDGRLNSSREVFKKKPLRAAVFIGARKFK